MNNLNSAVLNTFLAIFFLHATPSLAGTESTTDTNPGRITFIYENGIEQCGVDASPQVFEISYYAGGPGIRPCDHSRVRFIKLDGVRSAVTIRLWSYLRGGKPGGCQSSETHNFTLYLRTIKNPTNTQMIDLRNFADYPLNTPIQPGVTLTNKYIKDANKIDKNLSCVQVIYD